MSNDAQEGNAEIIETFTFGRHTSLKGIYLIRMLLERHRGTLPLDSHASLWFCVHCDGSCTRAWHNGQRWAMRLEHLPGLTWSGDGQSPSGMRTSLWGIHPFQIWSSKNSQHMALECKYPVSAKTSWPPPLCSNRLWKDGAKCLGIMLVLCDNAGCSYYKPTIVRQRLKKELE